MSLLDLIRKAKPKELREAAVELEAVRIAPKPRPEMPEDERRAFGAQLRERYEVFIERRTKLHNAIAEAEQRRRATEAEELALREEDGRLGPEYTDFRDPVMDRLWRERPALADELIERVKAEAHSLRAAWFEVPGPGVPVVRPTAPGELLDPTKRHSALGLPYGVSNRDSVEQRRSTLFALAEAIKDWTAKGEYGTTAELQAKFNAAYRELPKVEPITAVMERDPGARKYVSRVGPQPPFPPAA